MEKALAKGEVKKGVTATGVELFFFPQHALTHRDIYKENEEAVRKALVVTIDN